MKPEQSNKGSTTATTKPKPTASTSIPPPPATTQPTTGPVSTSVPDTTTTTTTTPSVVKPEQQLENKVEQPEPTTQPNMASEIIQVDDEEEDYNEKYNITSQLTRNIANSGRSLMPQTTSAVSFDKEATAQRYQRAQEIFKKYNLEMDPADWQQPNNSSGQRVEKQPRMRVRYTCHECKHTFGRDKKCSNCTHTRCDSCVRYPAKKTGGKAKKPMKVVVDPATLTAPTTGACHECKTTFDLGATECETCNHKICSRCLKETVIASAATAPPPAQPISIATAS